MLTYETERKYLLDTEPPGELLQKPTDIEQFYLSRQHEPYELRLRKKSNTTSTTYSTTVKSGDLPTRLEIESDISEETYNYWIEQSTTDIIRKRRYTIARPLGIWSLDYFDNGILLLEAEGDGVELPDFGSDVTHDKRFRNSMMVAYKKLNNQLPAQMDLAAAVDGAEKLLDKLKRPIVIAVSGASGSGKTTTAKTLQVALGERAAVISQDDYYRGTTKLKQMFGDDYEPNWDQPIALDLTLLASHLGELQENKEVELPIYQMTNCEPAIETRTINPNKTPIIILEGIHALNEKIAGWVDFGLYVDVDMATRIGRRIERDVAEGRTFPPSENLRYMLEVAEPTYRNYAAQQKTVADRIISGVTI